MNFHGKVALVTGGSKGIGRAVCLALAKVGASVVVNYSSDAGAAEEVVKSIAPGSGKAVAIKADVSSVAGVEDLVSKTVAEFGKIDVLVANAGVLPMKDLKNTTEADWDSTFALNVKGPYFLAQVSRPSQLQVLVLRGGRRLNRQGIQFRADWLT
jgi:3-oxoacyl-[acyl-carrier protein] reductase